VIERLRGFVNVASDDDFKLIVSWLVAALHPGIPFPILIINGPQGAGKSMLCKMLRSLIDPDIALVCSPPRNERDLVLAAANTMISAYDNLSGVDGFLPDALCRLASGGGFRTRSLHTNREETVFFVQRPVLLNGIPALTDAADLADRAIVVNLVSRRSAEPRTIVGANLIAFTPIFSVRCLMVFNAPWLTSIRFNSINRVAWPISKNCRSLPRRHSAGPGRTFNPPIAKIRPW
jgi:hypothetical protein